MHNTLPPYLPMSDIVSVVLKAAHTNGKISSWVKANTDLTDRLCSQGLLQRDNGVLSLTPTGVAAAIVVIEHYHLPDAYTGGNEARCLCGRWRSSVNETGDAAREHIIRAHAAHLAAEIAKIQRGS